MRTATAITLLALPWGLFGQQATFDGLTARAARDSTDAELVRNVVATASFGRISPVAMSNSRDTQLSAWSRSGLLEYKANIFARNFIFEYQEYTRGWAVGWDVFTLSACQNRGR